MMSVEVMGAMSPQREWIRDNMKKRTSEKTLEIQEAKHVDSKAFLFWDSYNEGTYDVGKRKAKREKIPKKTYKRYLDNKSEAKEYSYE
ncbi:MAG: hypothetical protein QGH83_00575 [Candidatus Pacebacteria bacterium]|jgi:hypothetical protein|nr:hypothetical protein [Candidatus Paceibacterota bacterium]